jgi:predicted small metal-binding protein
VRVIECNTCGEPLAAADDEELAARLREHMGRRHPDASLGEEQARELLAREAYSATDS